jgi:hypothetical protein
VRGDEHAFVMPNEAEVVVVRFAISNAGKELQETGSTAAASPRRSPRETPQSISTSPAKDE